MHAIRFFFFFFNFLWLICFHWKRPLFMCSPNRYRFARSTFFRLPNRYRFSRSTFFWLTNRYDFPGAHFFNYRTDNGIGGCFRTSLTTISCNAVSTRHRFDVDTTLFGCQQRCYNVETTYVYWVTTTIRRRQINKILSDCYL